MLTVLGILAEIYLDNLRQETIKGKRQRACEGFWNGLPPFGYCRGLCAECKDPNGNDYCPDYGSPNKTDGKRLILHPMDSEVEALVLYAGMSGGVTTTSYQLGQLSERRMNLSKMVLPQKKFFCRFPLLWQLEVTYIMEPGRNDQVITRQQAQLWYRCARSQVVAR